MADRADGPEQPRGGAPLTALILHRHPELARIWARFLEREGLEVRLAASAAEAIEAIRAGTLHAAILDMDAPEALAVADFAAYRCPDLPVISVSGRSFFSDSAIFEFVPNARSVLREPVRPDDVAAVTGHYALRYRTRASATSGPR